MSRDLLTELRRSHATLAECPTAMGQECFRCAAASEIEKLRADNARLRDDVATLNLEVMRVKAVEFSNRFTAGAPGV